MAGRISSARVSTLLLGALVRAATLRGLPAEAIVARSGIDLDSGPYVAHDDAMEFLRALEHAAMDPLLGVSLAMKVPAGGLDLTAYAARNSVTLGAALERVVRFAPLLHDAADVRVIQDKATVRVIVGLREGLTIPRSMVEFVLTLMLRVGREITANALEGAEVELSHSPPPDPKAMGRALGLFPKYRAPYDCLVLPPALLDMPIRTPDTQLAGVIDRVAAEKLRATSSSVTVRGKVADELRRRMAGGAATASEVAAALAMSPRTLRRRLADENTTFQDVLDEVRCVLAQRMLDEGTAVSEVSDSLGFSDPSSLRRALRRWRGDGLVGDSK